ncbi:MAG TPA: hypothetical protein P5084_13065 [Paludibacter sp.]|nr:hypothetical protein [Paludibacter sp.]
MKNADEKLELLIDNLRKQKPELNDSGLLTDGIMNDIAKKRRTNKPVLLIWVRTLSTAAAIFLFALYLVQYSSDQNIAKTTTAVRDFERNIKIDSECIQRNKNRKVNLIKTYKCHLRKNTLKNKHLLAYYQQFINYKNENNN